MDRFAAYAASKAALDAMVRTVSLEVESVRIRVNNVNPGIMREHAGIRPKTTHKRCLHKELISYAKCANAMRL